jgi:predicted dienelactone hydrolase
MLVRVLTTSRLMGLATLVASLFLLAAAPVGAQAERPYSDPGVEAPELAKLGPHGVGVHTLTLIEPGVPDVLHIDKASHKAPTVDRTLTVEVWYPATPQPSAARVVYEGAMESEDARMTAFQTPGVAVRDAPADRGGGPYPLVIMAHGYSGTPVAMSWLAENLASKGYVVVAAHHMDPPYGDKGGFVGPALWRPLDIAFLAHFFRASAIGGSALFGIPLDPDRVVLAGYSMGGYGVITAGGAGLSPVTASLAGPGGYLSSYARGGANAASLHIDGLKAVIAIAPAGGSGFFSAWDGEGLRQLHAPLLLIAGDQDKTVGYASPKTIFEHATRANRYLLTFHEGGHSIGMNGAPPSMRSKLWDEDWFEDPVWRKGRVIGVQLHFITAFLDVYVKGDASDAAYLNVIPNSNDGVWPPPKPGAPYSAYSPGSDGITVWKGFQRNHATGLSFEHRAADGG